MPPPLPSRPLGFKLYGTADGSSPKVVVEIFQDLCCPFSRKVNAALTAPSTGILALIQSDPALSSSVEIIFHPLPQPWHPQSPIMHECLMAVALATDHDLKAVAKYIQASYDNFDKFTDKAVMGSSRLAIHESCAEMAADALGGKEEFPDLGAHDEIKARVLTYLDLTYLTDEEPHMGLGEATKALKFAVKHHRLRGVHVTPTVFVNGVEAADVSSGWTPGQWIEKLTAVVEGRA